MKEIIICVGISGSGKSSWTTQFIKDNLNYLRINRDDIRRTLVGNLDGYYQRKDLNSIEKIINYTEENLIKSLEWGNYNIIIDNTNLKESYINKWFELTESLETTFDFKFKLFDIALEKAKQRVCIRDNFIFNKDVEYIDKQFEQYKQIKKFIETNYKDKII